MSFCFVGHCLLLAIEKFVGQGWDVWGHRVHLYVEADEAITAAFLAIEIGTRLPVQPFCKLSGYVSIFEEKIVNRACRDRELGWLGVLVDHIPAGNDKYLAYTPGDQVSPTRKIVEANLPEGQAGLGSVVCGVNAPPWCTAVRKNGWRDEHPF